jgi:hypothetical protein
MAERTIAGPLADRHVPETCYGSRNHCYSCHVDEPDEPSFISCLECRHVWRTAEDLLAAHNEHLADRADPEAVQIAAAFAARGVPVLPFVPEMNAAHVYCCALCIHDF